VDVGLSSRGRYVVKAAVFLAAAYRSGRHRTRREVSDAMGLPPTFVPQVMSDLARAGLVVSAPGLGGGYRLARPPELVSLLEVVEAGEGPLDAGNVEPSPLATGAGLPLLVRNEASTRVRSVLGATTLAQLVGLGDARAQPVAPLPCGVLAVRSPSSSGVTRAGVAGIEEIHEQLVAEEVVERDRDRVGVPASPHGGDGRRGEERGVDDDGEQ
jgi:Rrf2 family protein